MGPLERKRGNRELAVEGHRNEIGEGPLWRIWHGSQLVHQACGFEMLYQESKNRSDAISTSFETTVLHVRSCRFAVTDKRPRMRFEKVF